MVSNGQIVLLFTILYSAVLICFPQTIETSSSTSKCQVVPGRSFQFVSSKAVIINSHLVTKYLSLATASCTPFTSHRYVLGFHRKRRAWETHEAKTRGARYYTVCLDGESANLFGHVIFFFGCFCPRTKELVKICVHGNRSIITA